MAQYEKVFTKPYEDGYENLPSQNTPITASTLNDKDAAIEHIEDFLDGQEFPTAEEKAVWNDAQNLYKYTLLDQVAQINSNVSGSVPPIAVKNYSKGELFIQQKKLLKAITNISLGDDLIKNTNYIEVNVGDELGLKTDISAIGTDESGRTTASRQYTYGERFYKDGKFCRTKGAVAQGATWTLNTNYEESDIGDCLQYYATQVTPSAGVTFDRNHVSVFGKMVNVYLKMFTFADSSTFAHQLGSLTTLRPAAEYAFLTIASAADPYDTLGHVFITGSDGRVGMPKGLPDSTNVFIHGTYITKD